MKLATTGTPKIVPITGAGACAEAMRQINPDVVAAFRRWDQEIGVGHNAPQ